jgi:GNAT superfamily N-acetyltransferase
LIPIGQVRLGGGAPRIWPGVPYAEQGAREFFASNGFDFSEPDSYDLRGSLHGYASPPYIKHRLQTADVSIGAAEPDGIEGALLFEQHEFPAWAPAYQLAVELGDWRDVIIARAGSTGAIVGTALVCGPDSHKDRSDRIWTGLFGVGHGTLGAVGVAPAARNQGIGVGGGLVDAGSYELSRRGVGTCLIGFTSLCSFYGRLGCTPWQRYAMRKRVLTST